MEGIIRSYSVASILTRQWAKKNASIYLDSTPTSSPLNAKSLQSR